MRSRFSTSWPENKPLDVVRTSTIRIIRAGRPVPVRVTAAMQFDGGGWSFSVKAVRFPRTRRRYRLTCREQDRAIFRAAAAVA